MLRALAADGAGVKLVPASLHSAQVLDSKIVVRPSQKRGVRAEQFVRRALTHRRVALSRVHQLADAAAERLGVHRVRRPAERRNVPALTAEAHGIADAGGVNELHARRREPLRRAYRVRRGKLYNEVGSAGRGYRRLRAAELVKDRKLAPLYEAAAHHRDYRRVTAERAPRALYMEKMARVERVVLRNYARRSHIKPPLSGINRQFGVAKPHGL